MGRPTWQRWLDRRPRGDVERLRGVAARSLAMMETVALGTIVVPQFGPVVVALAIMRPMTVILPVVMDHIVILHRDLFCIFGIVMYVFFTVRYYIVCDDEICFVYVRIDHDTFWTHVHKLTDDIY